MTATKWREKAKRRGLTYSCIIWRRVEILNLRSSIYINKVITKDILETECETYKREKQMGM